MKMKPLIKVRVTILRPFWREFWRRLRRVVTITKAGTVVSLALLCGCASPGHGPNPFAHDDPLWPHTGWSTNDVRALPASAKPAAIHRAPQPTLRQVGQVAPDSIPPPFERVYGSPRLLGDATSPSNSWLAATAGFATYKDPQGYQGATYLQLAIWQHGMWALNTGIVTPLGTPERFTHEFSITAHWPPDSRDWSFEAGVYGAIGRGWSLPPTDCFGAMVGVRRDTGITGP